MYKSSFKDHLNSIKHDENSKAKNKKRLRIERPKFYCNKCKFEMLTKSFFQKHLSAKHLENPKKVQKAQSKKI